MVNEFLLPVTINGRHPRDCFCVGCRQHKVSIKIDWNSTNTELENAFLSDAEEYRRLNALFNETLNSIIRGEAYRQQCLQNTHYTSFGWWMNSQPQYAGLTGAEKQRLRRKVRTVHAVFTHWETIVRNLNDEKVVFLDARRLSVDQLHEAINIGWCYDQDEILRRPGDVPDELSYDEAKYRRILEFITTTGILVDINHDRKECTRLSRRLQRDLGKICHYISSDQWHTIITGLWKIKKTTFVPFDQYKLV